MKTLDEFILFFCSFNDLFYFGIFYKNKINKKLNNVKIIYPNPKKNKP